MNAIHQIYCTHCTYGSSALEQREGELAERVLGYSARAGSLERNELRGYYRQLERFLYYYLPSDSPPEERLKLDAATAPRRMFYSPCIGRLRVLGQVAYRRHDTVGRAGSYFAHVLFGERGEAPWPVLDCLRLWGAPWVIEDAPGHPKRLPTLGALRGGGLRGVSGGGLRCFPAGAPMSARPEAIDDGVLLSFLKTPRGQAFDDPQRVVPERWRAVSPDERAALLIDVAQAYIKLGSDRRASVLLVCEPSLAALVFYGVARLLPCAVRSGVSFSTYEPSADRLPVALAATTFYAPDTTDLKVEAYRRRGYVYNTYLNRRSDLGRPCGHYARLLIETLLSQGWPAVDALLDGFAAARCGKVEELEILVQRRRLAPRLLDPAAGLAWRPRSTPGTAIAAPRPIVRPPTPPTRIVPAPPRQNPPLAVAAAAPLRQPPPSPDYS